MIMSTNHIFISYSNKDKELALRLAGDLERFYEVWIDKAQLEGGLEWEEAIEKALTECHVFAVLVSNHSNKSEWVARETIRAEQLGKYRVPLLVNGELPLRLLNMQYVDFQGEYEGGFRDLLEVLKKQLEPQDRQQATVNRLIGEAVRAYLQGSYPKANSLIGQALILDPKLAPSETEFWSSLRVEQKTNWARELMPQIQIRERAKRTQENVYSKQAGEQVDMHQWMVEIAASPDVLERIDYVQYGLHETFREPIQIVRARDKKFPLGGQAWGTFDIQVTIYFTDNTVGHGIHPLEFLNRQIPLTDVNVSP